MKDFLKLNMSPIGINQKNENKYIKQEVTVIQTIGYVVVWLCLNALLIAIGVMSFYFMFDQVNFYGKGSTGVLIGIAFAMYKTHSKYFGYVVGLIKLIQGKE